MATTKKRINITADTDIELALRFSARRDKMPVATKAAELLRVALSIEEDLRLADIARSREKEVVKYIRHESAWR
ncbi:MAG: hypothetical protein KAR00_03240 [Candidatus Pacebacteria bacterium]|nr:hypothetical protein [Candidatus Paceibacterota bacterium]